MVEASLEAEEQWIPSDLYNVVDVVDGDEEEESGTGILDTKDWPAINWSYTERKTGGGVYPELTPDEPMVDIRVGESRSKRWLVHKRLICSECKLLSREFSDTKDERSLRWRFPNQHPIAFKLFLEWLYSQPVQQAPPLMGFPPIGRNSLNTWVPNYNPKWRLYASEAYFLAEELECERFKQYSLSKILSSIHEYGQSDFEFIYSRLGDETATPLALLSHHWVQWRDFNSRGIWQWTKCKRFKLDLTTHHCMNSIDTRDISFWHWFDCSQPNPSTRCVHHTLKRYSTRDPSLKWNGSLYRRIHKWNERPSEMAGPMKVLKGMKAAWDDKQSNDAIEKRVENSEEDGKKQQQRKKLFSLGRLEKSSS